MVAQYYEEIRKEINCCACGHCCHVMSPRLIGKDLKRLADYLTISRNELISEYLEPSKEERGYVMKKRPCPFLENQRCTIYDVRPDDCRSFPHMHKRDFRSGLMQVVNNCSICPIVYNVFERLKQDLWRRSRL
jgi:Fe-S-cluster containining protein